MEERSQDRNQSFSNCQGTKKQSIFHIQLSNRAKAVDWKTLTLTISIYP
jgi:hypothetical protein